MPYYRCAECDLTVYSAAGHSNSRVCPDCDADLDAAQPVFVGKDRADLAANVKPLASDGALA